MKKESKRNSKYETPNLFIDNLIENIFMKIVFVSAKKKEVFEAEIDLVKKGLIEMIREMVFLENWNFGQETKYNYKDEEPSPVDYNNWNRMEIDSRKILKKKIKINTQKTFLLRNSKIRMSSNRTYKDNKRKQFLEVDFNLLNPPLNLRPEEFEKKKNFLHNYHLLNKTKNKFLQNLTIKKKPINKEIFESEKQVRQDNFKLFSYNVFGEKIQISKLSHPLFKPILEHPKIDRNFKMIQNQSINENKNYFPSLKKSQSKLTNEITAQSKKNEKKSFLKNANSKKDLANNESSNKEYEKNKNSIIIKNPKLLKNQNFISERKTDFNKKLSNIFPKNNTQETKTLFYVKNYDSDKYKSQLTLKDLRVMQKKTNRVKREKKEITENRINLFTSKKADSGKEYLQMSDLDEFNKKYVLNTII